MREFIPVGLTQELPLHRPGRACDARAMLDCLRVGHPWAVAFGMVNSMAGGVTGQVEEKLLAHPPAPQSQHRVVDEQPPINPWMKLAGDINGDGKLDIAIGGQNGPLVWHVNPGWRKVVVSERGSQDIRVADFTEDGRPDILAANHGGSLHPVELGVLRNDGSVTKGGVTSRQRGVAQVEVTRPKHFPHRIWAACDFEGRTPDYAWFGPAETNNIPRYPGNTTALGVGSRPYQNFSALMTGINPVPGPRMGKVNHLYLRYFLRGATEAAFQQFSLTSEDNNHIDAGQR